MEKKSEMNELFQRFKNEVLVDVKDEKMKDDIVNSFIMALAKS
ncbi:hypothetical protein [Alkalibacter mobilis]|nr:hypothetical protein [Alkalibacter mobilis]